MEQNGEYVKINADEARSMRFSPEFWGILFEVLEEFDKENLFDIESMTEDDARLFWTEVAARTFAQPDEELGADTPSVDEAIELIRIIMQEEMKDMLLAAFKKSLEQGENK